MSHTSSLQNPRLVVLTALITAVTSIAVSIVGIFPQLHSRTIPQVTATTAPTPPAAEKWTIRGEVKDRTSKKPVKGADVVLVTMTPQSISNTGNDGSFELSGVPAGTYALVVREQDGGSRVMIPQKRADGSDILIGEVPDQKDLPKTFISYKIEK
jgi:Carboxypeptidase regulatory-like domain